ncbi:MAG: DUF1559 domain-containing protein [Candidatus Hydrogenedens sp.]|nr:DUF1559 domain-containing protein [Candidatus Hydrogenedens sp.]
MPALARARESARRASCQNNLKQWGLVFKMYSGESAGGKYPPVPMEYTTAIDCDQIGFPSMGNKSIIVAGPSPKAVYPEYLTDVNILISHLTLNIPLKTLSTLLLSRRI